MQKNGFLRTKFDKIIPTPFQYSSSTDTVLNCLPFAPASFCALYPLMETTKFLLTFAKKNIRLTYAAKLVSLRVNFLSSYEVYSEPNVLYWY